MVEVDTEKKKKKRLKKDRHLGFALLYALYLR